MKTLHYGLAIGMAHRLMENILVPWHEIVSEAEKARILKQYGLSEERMPQIRCDDPVVQELGAKRGNLIKIYRKSHTAGESVYYRIVE